ncbi:MAG: oligosaccharide flippase family protein [Promethearchaeota archaeon]
MDLERKPNNLEFKMRNKQEAFKSFFIISISLIIAFVSNLLIVLILTHNFPPGEYAVYQFSLTFLTFFTIFSNIGLSTTIIQQLSAEKDKDHHKLVRLFSEGLKWIILFTLIFSLILFFSADFFEIFYQLPGLGIVLKFTSLILISNNIVNYFESIFQGLWKFKLFAISFIFSKVIKVVIVSLIFIIDMSLPQIIALFSIALLIQLIVILGFSQIKYRYLSSFFSFNRELSRTLLKFSIFIFLYVFFQNVITYSNQFILAAFVIPAEIAHYTIVQWMIVSFSIPAIIFSRFILPYVSHYIQKVEEERGKIQTIYNLIFRYGLLLTIPISFYFLIFSDPLIALMFDPSYYPVSNYLKLYIFFLNINIIDVAGGHFLWASNEPKLVYKLYAVTSFFTLTMSFILIPILYTLGAILSIMIPHSIYTIYSIFLVKRKNKIEFDSNLLPTIFKYIISAFSVMILLYVINLIFQFNLNNILILLTFSGIYFGIFLIMILLLRGVTLMEIKDFIKLLRNSIFKN